MTRGASSWHAAREGGFAYLFAMLATALLAGAVLVTVEESSLDLAMARNRMEITRSEWLARGAVHQAAWRMRYDSSYRTLVGLGQATNFVLDPLLGGGSYDYDVDKSGGNWLITGKGGAGGGSFVTRQLVPDSLLARQFAAPCVADTWIAEASPNTNYGGADDLSLRVIPGGRQRLLLRFSLSGFPLLTPAKAAYLELWLGKASGDETIRLDVHDMTTNWTEGTRQGSGVADGATWNDAMPGNPWKNPGTDGCYGADRADVARSTEPGVLRWDITALVNDWLTGAQANHGITIHGHNEVETLPVTEERTFSSREESGGARRPVIIIQY